MFTASSMKKDLWVSHVNLSVDPREYAQPVCYKVNVIPTYAGADVVAYGSRLSEIERVRMDKTYGADIKEYDRVWIQNIGEAAPTWDKLAKTATHVVRSVRDTPRVRSVEIRRIKKYANDGS